VSAPFLTSLLPYYSCFHSLFLSIPDFPQNSRFSLCTFLYFYLLKFSYCYRCFFFFFGSLQLFISRDLRSFSYLTQGKNGEFSSTFRDNIKVPYFKSQTVYPSMLCNIPEELRFHLHRGGSPKSRVFISAVQTVLFRLFLFCLIPHKRLIPLFFYSTLTI